MTSTPRTLKIDRTWDGRIIPDNEVATITLSLQGSDLRIQVDAPLFHDPRPPGPAGTTDRLWEYEVVELFIAGARGRYTEIEMSPWGHHLVLQFDGVRQQTAIHLPLRYTAQRGPSRWQAEALLSLDLLPVAPHKVNAVAIRGQGEDRTFLSAVALPGPEADFHQPDRFSACMLFSSV